MRLPFDKNRFERENSLRIQYQITSFCVGILCIPALLFAIFMSKYSYVFDIFAIVSIIGICNMIVALFDFFRLKELLNMKQASKLSIQNDEIKYRSRKFLSQGLFKPKKIEKYNYAVKVVDEYLVTDDSIIIYGCIHKHDGIEGHNIEVVHELIIPDCFANKGLLIKCLKENMNRYSSLRWTAWY